jgi:WD40 repeat protein/tRNA A-37 threonylcarbamoyl transferase component Bud32/uncharacterized protein YbaR (Trm112 family)
MPESNATPWSGSPHRDTPPPDGLHLVCPHCRNPIEVVSTKAEEVVCPACGSSFRLEQPAATLLVPDSPRRLGKFALVKVVGVGAFGTVFKALDHELDRVVAIKVPRPGNLAAGQELNRFLREARNLAQLRHPFIVSVYEVGEAEGVPFLVNEFVEGVTLADRLTAQRLSPREAAQIMATVADALQYAHETGVIHRDVKPSNIMLSSDGTPRLTDFGLAKREAGEITMTIDGQVLGTPAYMSPEQARGEGRLVDGRSDVYSVGVILYELLTGELPFRGNTRMLLHQVLHDEPRPPRRLNDRIPRDLETICLKAMAKEPGRWYGTAGDLSEDLRRYLRGEPVRARPVGKAEQLWRWCARNPVVAGLVAALIGTLAVGLVGVSWKWWEAEDLRRQAEAHRHGAEQSATAEYRARQEAETRRREAMVALANLTLEHGLNLCKDNDVPRGMLWLARGLEITPDGSEELRRVMRVNLAAWHRHMRTLKGNFVHPTAARHIPLESAAFSPDGRLLATVGAPPAESTTPALDTTTRLWDVQTGRPIGQPMSNNSWGRAVVFSPDSKTLLTATDNGTVELWNAATGQAIASAASPRKASVRFVVFAPGGETIVTGDISGLVQWWEPNGLKPRSTTAKHPSAILAGAISRDGKLLATGGVDKTVRLWDAVSGQPIGEPLIHDSEVTGVAFSPDGKKVLTGSRPDGKGQIWDVSTGKSMGLGIQQAGGLNSVAFAPDGRTVLTGGVTMTAQLWDASTRAAVGEVFQCNSEVRSVAFSPKGDAVLLAGWDGMARVWELPRDPVRKVAQPYLVAAVAFDPHGQTFLTGGISPFSRQGEARLFHTATTEPRGAPLPHPKPVLAAAFSPDGATILTGTGDPTLGRSPAEARLWDAATGKLIGQPLPHGGSIAGVSFSPAGTTFLTACSDWHARLWDVSSRKLLQTFEHSPAQGAVTAVAFSPDERIIITGSGTPKTGQAIQWDLISGKMLGKPMEHGSIVLGVAYGADGKRILTGSADHTARLWDAHSCQPMGSSVSHTNFVRPVAFSPDGQTILTGSWDGMAQLWDAATRKPLGPALKHDGWVTSAAFSPDGRTILTGSGDLLRLKGEARLYDVPLPVSGDVERIVLWVQVLTRMELEKDGTLRSLSSATWSERRARLAKLGGPPIP